jgi:hypothetical protein
MFVLLNGKKYQIYELETMESLKIRIASNNPPIEGLRASTLPSLIRLEEVEDVKFDAKVVAGCRAVHIRPLSAPLKSLETNPLAGRKFKLYNFGSFAQAAVTRAAHDPKLQREGAAETMKFFDLTDENDYVKYTLYFVFGGIEGLGRVNPAIQVGFKNAVDTGLGTNGFVSLQLHYDQDAKDLKAKIEENILAARKDLALFTAFERTFAYVKDPDFEPPMTSPLQQDKTWLAVKFEINTDVYELLNGMNFSPNVPFAGVGNFYKTLKTFKPPTDWASLQDDQDTLVMYVLNRQTEPQRNRIKTDPKNYSKVTITPGEMDEKTHITPVEMEIRSRVDDELKEDQLLERIFDAFPKEFKVSACSYEQKKVEADYLLLAPDVALDIPLFVDMVMNDPLMSQLMVIDETSRTYRERGGIFFYLRYNSHTDPKNYLSCRLNIGPVEARHQVRAPEIFRVLGEQFLSVKLLNPKTLQEAERVKFLINLILEYYFS